MWASVKELAVLYFKQKAETEICYLSLGWGRGDLNRHEGADTRRDEHTNNEGLSLARAEIPSFCVRMMKKENSLLFIKVTPGRN